MANPYKKAEQVQKKAPGSRPETVKQPVVEKPEVKEEPVVVAAPVVAEVKAEVPVAPVVATEEKVSVKEDFLGDIVGAKPKAKSYGFYLDDEVVAALEKLAKQKKVSKSKVGNLLQKAQTP